MSGSIPTHGPTDPATGAPIVEVVSAGNEVLIGDVLDTNTNWLCVKVTGLGGLVRRTVMRSGYFSSFLRSFAFARINSVSRSKCRPNLNGNESQLACPVFLISIFIALFENFFSQL